MNWIGTDLRQDRKEREAKGSFSIDLRSSTQYGHLLRLEEKVSRYIAQSSGLLLLMILNF